ncbi:MAG: thioesterase family protein [Actinomycetota bacterium]
MQDINLKVGLSGTARTQVNQNNTAVAYGSGNVDVFATPAMVGLMEKAAIEAVDRNLPEGFASVGTRVDIKHLAATPIGMSVTANAILVEAEGPKLKFKVEAYDGKEKIGEGIHSRYVVNLDDLRRRANEKKR